MSGNREKRTLLCIKIEKNGRPGRTQTRCFCPFPPEIVPRLVEATRRGAEQTRCNKVALLRTRKEQSLRWIAAKPKQQYCVLQ